jgi:hypothetical protein
MGFCVGGVGAGAGPGAGSGGGLGVQVGGAAIAGVDGASPDRADDDGVDGTEP